jgi:hypothetical protein
MIKRFLNVFIFYSSSPSGSPALLCMQFADSADNIAAGALIQTNMVFYTHEMMRACPTIPLSGQSNLVRRYL